MTVSFHSVWLEQARRLDTHVTKHAENGLLERQHVCVSVQCHIQQNMQARKIISSDKNIHFLPVCKSVPA